MMSFQTQRLIVEHRLAVPKNLPALLGQVPVPKILGCVWKKIVSTNTFYMRIFFCLGGKFVLFFCFLPSFCFEF